MSVCPVCGITREYGDGYLHTECEFQSKNYITDLQRNRRKWEGESKRITPLVLMRDKNTCRICGSTNNLTIDHITPISQGGGNDMDNLQVLCGSCNSKKGGR